MVVAIEKNLDKGNDNREPSAVNIFLIYSPLHYLAAESVAEHFGQNARNYLFFLKAEFKEMVDVSRWDSTEFLPWPRFYPDKGIFGRLRRTRKNLDIVATVCQGAREIRLHTPVIDTEAVNYLINHLRKMNPDALVCVRLIPDGLLNVQRHPLGRFKEALQYVKKLRRLVYPSLNYYTFRGDRTGSDAEIVDRIYVLPGLPHEYDSSRTMEISLFKGDTCQNLKTNSSVEGKRALVIGQPLRAYKRFSDRDVRAVTSGIRTFIGACGIKTIYFKSHPRDPDNDLASQDYKELTIGVPLELYLSSASFDLVIGVYSTALVTARIILPQSCRVIAYATNSMKYRSAKEKTNILSTFKSLGIELVMHNG